ncbi:MAG: glycosyltransferase family 4 protein, partial [Candidatus Daviesbacteria bacterium]|nr:glycosyltransferase family 4 protein [Candidatus Daviesbacteria bacterium]
PFLVMRNWAGGEKNAIEQKLKKEKFDLIHAETFYVMPHIPKTNIPILLVEQTIEYLVYSHFADQFKTPFIKPLLYIDVAKMKYWELKYWQKAARVAAMSEEDRKTMIAESPQLNVDIVPNGVDSEFFGKVVAGRSKDQIILYLGNFTWLQNREAVEVLINKVWPKIKSQLPNAKLWIAGKEAPSFFAKLASEDIKIMEVADVREVYQKASVLVAPIYGGGGTRYKNFEAFASGLPVVTTTIGIRGTEAIDGKEVIISDNTQDLAKEAVKLLTDKILYQKIADNAKKMVKEKYDWDPIAKKLSDIYKELGYRV